MKNMKRILALVCIALLAMSATCFAFEADQSIDFLLKANKTTISAGDAITVTLYADKLTGTDQISYGTYYIYFDSNEFEVEGSTADSSVTGYNAKVGTIIESEITMDWTNIATYTFTAKSDLADGDYTIRAQEILLMDANANMCNPDEALCSDELTITVGAAYPTLDEETFTADGTEDGVPVENGSKAWTVFQKTDTDLAAESYGVQVVTGGKTYKFPGKVAITLGEATEKIWGIKLIAPAGKFQDGAAFAPTSIKAYDPTGEYDELVK